MSLGDIESFEIVIVQFHLGSFHHFKPKMGKDLNDFVQDLRDRMSFAHGNASARKGNIYLFLLQRLLLFLLFQLDEGFFNL
jgi:hypothetical protein